MINFINVSKIYNHSSVALDNISFRVAPKEFVTVVGKSGAGKSTIVKLIIGEEKPTKGRVLFANHEVNKLSYKELPLLRGKIGIIFQDFRLLPAKSVYENAAFAMEVAGKPQVEINEVIPQVLDMVGLADKKLNFPRELSGGERQRAAIARAMVNRPVLIIADEPTGNLDPANTWEIIRILLKINELGTTVLLATHNKDIINNLGKRVISIKDGKIIKDEENGRYILG
ncbi:MAG: cell division ATP-binding protein FtsE [Patescibacteria group bacterium]